MTGSGVGWEFLHLGMPGNHGADMTPNPSRLHRSGGTSPRSLGIMKRLCYLLAVMACSFAGNIGAQSNIQPQSGLVPTEETAVAIAIAVFTPIFGADRIKEQQPFHATLRSGVWHVSGSLPPGTRGGTAEAAIERKDGRILRVWHGR